MPQHPHPLRPVDVLMSMSLVVLIPRRLLKRKIQNLGKNKLHRLIVACMARVNGFNVAALMRGGVSLGLQIHMTQFRAFPLGLNDAAGSTIDEQHVIRRPRVGIHLAHGHTRFLHQVNALLVLHRPAGRLEFCIDFLAGFGFEPGVFRDQFTTPM